MPDGDAVAALVSVSGTRRQTVALYVRDVVYITLRFETGQASVEFKARSLWAEGFAAVARRWLDAVSWWTRGRRSRSLDEAHANGWATTQLEVCSDFVGLEFRDSDRHDFVGFNKNDVVQSFGARHRLETLNIGRRDSPISLCLYDKDVQLARAKGGDDSTYRAVHLANGWDGEAPRRRVEFRVNQHALLLGNDETGEVLDLRNPATLADRGSLCRAWAVFCTKKRLVLRDTSSRITRADLDPRWAEVVRASGQGFEEGFRQVREPQRDAWQESVRRSRRKLDIAAAQVAALHDHPTATLAEVLDFVAETESADDAVARADFAARCRATRDAFMGVEIKSLGRERWATAHAARVKRLSMRADDAAPPGVALVQAMSERAITRAMEPETS